MYLETDQVKDLVLELQARYPGSEMVCEVVNKRWLSPFAKMIIQTKMRREVKMGENADYHFGLNDSREMETWKAGILFLGDWSYFETNHPKLGWLRIIGKSHLFQRVQWTVHYRLG